MNIPEIQKSSKNPQQEMGATALLFKILANGKDDLQVLMHMKNVMVFVKDIMSTLNIHSLHTSCQFSDVVTMFGK